METIVITPKGLSFLDYLRDAVRYRRILGAFTYRVFRAKYAQTVLGLLWVLINPLVTLLILGVVFGKIAKLDTGGVDPFVFTMVGLAAWTYFSNVVGGACNLIVSSSNMIKKIYFPRILLPLSGVIVGLVELVVVIAMTFLLLAWRGQAVSTNAIFYPLLLILTVFLTAGVSFCSSAIVVRFRDFQHVLPFLLRIGLYATPVAYSLRNVESKYHLLFDLNPLTGIMEGLRWSIFGGEIPLDHILVTLVWTVLLWIFGLWYFIRVEKTMADIL